MYFYLPEGSQTNFSAKPLQVTFKIRVGANFGRRMGKGSGMVSEASGGPLCVMVHSTDHGGKCSSSHTASSETIIRKHSCNEAIL